VPEPEEAGRNGTPKVVTAQSSGGELDPSTWHVGLPERRRSMSIAQILLEGLEMRSRQ
jgi:hypothetical protein